MTLLARGEEGGEDEGYQDDEAEGAKFS